MAENITDHLGRIIMYFEQIIENAENYSTAEIQKQYDTVKMYRAAFESIENGFDSEIAKRNLPRL